VDITSLRRRVEQLIHSHSEVYAKEILNSGFSCRRCGWCCQENSSIRITEDIFRPSNVISIFPPDIRRIIKGTGMKWDEIAEPDIYSCLSNGNDIWAIGWILKRNDAGDCIFYRKGACEIYEWRPMICRCYPFFMGETGIDIMRCEGLMDNMTLTGSEEMGRMLKRYEIRKLQSYIRIMDQIKDRLDPENLCLLPLNFSGTITVCDGESISHHFIKKDYGIARI
jgi:Fe-S-cluster containining protein